MVKRCCYCGKYFTPDKRVGSNQKACHREECKKARKQEAQKNWFKKNPDYFKGDYLRIKEWRIKKKKDKISKDMIQDKIPHQTPYSELVLMIPDTKKDMIQDEIRLKRLDGHRFLAYG